MIFNIKGSPIQLCKVTPITPNTHYLKWDNGEKMWNILDQTESQHAQQREPNCFVVKQQINCEDHKRLCYPQFWTVVCKDCFWNCKKKKAAADSSDQKPSSPHFGNTVQDFDWSVQWRSACYQLFTELILHRKYIKFNFLLNFLLVAHEFRKEI